jgi:hypothetical protein
VKEEVEEYRGARERDSRREEEKEREGKRCEQE